MSRPRPPSPAPIAAIQGVVLDRETGSPVASALVELSADRETRTERADAEGRFHFTDLAEGSYRVEALHPGHRSTRSFQGWSLS